jgi:hypothetical protein
MTSSKASNGKRWLIGALLYLGAVALGVGSALLVLKKAPWLNPSVQVGPWRVNLHAGSVDADMYTRASVAVNGLLALGRDETMYFIAAYDDGGQALRSNCNYRIQGSAPAARWWSGEGGRLRAAPVVRRARADGVVPGAAGGCVLVKECFGCAEDGAGAGQGARETRVVCAKRCPPG